MILFPAIDLRDGRAVRLVQGDFDSVTVFNDDPVAQARLFAAAALSTEALAHGDLSAEASAQADFPPTAIPRD